MNTTTQLSTDLLTVARSLRKVGIATQYRDVYDNADAWVTLAGRCVVCRSRVYEVSTDGKHWHDPDPRGALNEHYACACLVAREYDSTGPDVPMCYDCRDDSKRYNQGLEIARQKWSKLAA